MPVKRMYTQRGLCAVIPATAGVSEVFSHTKRALASFVPQKPSKAQRRRSLKPPARAGLALLHRALNCL